MKRHIKICYGLLIVLGWPCFAMADQVTDDILHTAESYYHQLAPERTASDIKLVKNYGERAVVSLVHTAPAIDKDGFNAPEICSNFYLYLEKTESAWQMRRSTGALHPDLRSRADKARNTSAKELIKQMEQVMGVVGTPEYRVERMRNEYILASSLDDALIAHFNTNKADFDALKTALINLNPRTEQRYLADHFPREGMVQHFNKALIEYVNYSVLPDEMNPRSGCRRQECFTLTMAFSPPSYKVGYFFLEDSQRVPQATGREYLVIYPLGDGWYFFRMN